MPSTGALLVRDLGCGDFMGGSWWLCPASLVVPGYFGGRTLTDLISQPPGFGNDIAFLEL